MADPICRWRNPFIETVRELIEILPKAEMPSQAARDIVTAKKADFYRTPYQLACQLGLYFESDNTYYPKFTYIPTIRQVVNYLNNWLNNYYVPNPYTPQGFSGINPTKIHSCICDLLKNTANDIKWEETKMTLFGEIIGNDDILRNTINYYSEIIKIEGGFVKIREGLEYENLTKYILDPIDVNRNDKRTFFNTFSIVEEESLISPIIKSAQTNTIYYGSPGTGKSYKVNEIIKGLDKTHYERITFHPEYDYNSFVGGYKPISDASGSIRYEFSPQVFTNIYIRAWNDLERPYYLIIEEINRGNCAEIFGDIFQLLDRNSNYTVSPSEELRKYLNDKLGSSHQGVADGLKLPTNLTLLATMNTSDQSLFPMDSAFKRRWNWEYIPICYDDTDDNKSSQYIIRLTDEKYFKWLDFIKEVNSQIKRNENLGMDKCIGNYFIKSDNHEISLKEFINKAIFYLWNDVFKDEMESIFPKATFYEDFFPIETEGLKQVEKILENLGITTHLLSTEPSSAISEDSTTASETQSQ